MPENQISTVIGFDLGTVYTGVAVGQTITGQANPLQALKSRRRKPDWSGIASLITTWQPQKLIVGLPTRLDGSDDEMTDAAKKFGRQLEGRFHIDTVMVDERLTTREAYNISIESGEFKNKQQIDSISAVLLTESWLREYTASS
ncbi:MAG: Holliday junction resolvase RuvX [Gammaproteobacteria bacterium]|nr:Holliday junction resolvase RuvX [Gammaproteobacteria bacterium]